MNATAEAIPKVSKKKLKSIINDEEKTARAANLVYVTDKEPGIEREKNGDKFEYYYKEEKIKDDEELLRIKHLVISTRMDQSLDLQKRKRAPAGYGI